MMKYCINPISRALFTLFENIIKFSAIPQYLKIGKVTPVWKPGKEKNSITGHN